MWVIGVGVSWPWKIVEMSSAAPPAVGERAGEGEPGQEEWDPEPKPAAKAISRPLGPSSTIGYASATRSADSNQAKSLPPRIRPTTSCRAFKKYVIGWPCGPKLARSGPGGRTRSGRAARTRGRSHGHRPSCPGCRSREQLHLGMSAGETRELGRLCAARGHHDAQTLITTGLPRPIQERRLAAMPRGAALPLGFPRQDSNAAPCPLRCRRRRDDSAA